MRPDERTGAEKMNRRIFFVICAFTPGDFLLSLKMWVGTSDGLGVNAPGNHIYHTVR